MHRPSKLSKIVVCLTKATSPRFSATHLKKKHTLIKPINHQHAGNVLLKQFDSGDHNQIPSVAYCCTSRIKSSSCGPFIPTLNTLTHMPKAILLGLTAPQQNNTYVNRVIIYYYHMQAMSETDIKK